MRKTLIAIALVALIAMVAGPATAGGKGGGKGKAPTATGTFTWILLNSPDGTPNFGEDVTFEVDSNAYHPSVTLTCYQGGEWVTNETVGFYVGWPWSQVFPLRSWKWTGGAADCVAKLHYTDRRGRQITLDELSFYVSA